MSFAKNTSKNTRKISVKNWRVNTAIFLLDYAKQSATDAFRTSSKRTIQKTAGTSSYLVGKKIANTITEV